MPKTKVLFIHHCGTRSGAANSLISLIKSLDRNKFFCSVLCPVGSAFDAFKSVADEIYLIPELPEIASISGYPNNYLRLLKAVSLYPSLKEVVDLVNQVTPDIVHLNEISLTPLAKRLKKNGRKIIIHARVVLDHKTKWLNAFIIQRINKYVDFTICIDESVRNLLKGVENSSVVYNSYQFNSSELSTQSAGKQEKFIVLFLANLIKYKGVFDLLEAAKLLKRYLDIEIHIAGGNSRPDEFYESIKGKILSWLGLARNNRAIIQKMIDENGLNGGVKLIGNIKNIHDKIKNSAVNVFPSYMNGPSRSIFEAGVLGKPSIISLHYKIEDVVENGKTGLIIDEHSPMQIAEAILRFKNNPDFYQSVCRNAKSKYLTLNDPVLNARKVEGIYQKLLNDTK